MYLIPDADTVTRAMSSADSSLWMRVIETASPFVVTFIVGWLINSLRVKRRVRRSELASKEQFDGIQATFNTAISSLTANITTQLDNMRTATDKRLDGQERHLNAVAQEVWGAQKTNGMRGDVRQLKEDSKKQGELLVKIGTQVEMIARNLAS